MKLQTLLSVLFLLPAVALAAPVVGTYNSPDLGNDFLNGRWSEAYVGGSAGQIGNAIHAASWDGTALGTEWELSAPAISAAPVLTSDTVDAFGNGTRTWQTAYTGGTLTLENIGPWWNPADAPATQYIVNVGSYSHTTTKVYVNNVEQTFRTNVYMNGTVQGFPGYMVSFVVAVAAPLGEGSGIPVDFPSFAGTNIGAWGVVQKITMQVTPEPATLSLLALAGLAILRRRR